MKNTVEAVIASLFLIYILIITKDALTRIIIIPFLLFSITLFIKNISLILKKKKIAKICTIVNKVSFFTYYFGFLIYWDYLAIKQKNYMLVLFSLLPWAFGIFIAFIKYKKFKNCDMIDADKKN